MNTTEFLAYLRSLEVQLWVSGDRLHYDAPQGTMTPALQAELVARKAEILLLHQTTLVPPITHMSLRPTSSDHALPLSFAQQRFWFLDQLEPGNAAANIFRAFRLTGRLDVTALEQSLTEVVRRHEILRTTFPDVDGQPIQRMSPPRPVSLAAEDLRALSATEREARVQQRVVEEARQPFNLAQGPLFRVRLLQLADAASVLLLTLHHIVFDGWSFSILFHELTVLYRAFTTGKPGLLPDLPLQYRDFAVWQREWLQGQVLVQELAYWKQQLGGSCPMLDLPTDRPRPSVRTSRGASQSLALPGPLSAALKALCQQEGITLFMLLLAAFKTLLHRFTGQEDILVGTPAAGRNQAETERLIGFFVNTLVLRTNMDGNPPFREILRRVRTVALGAYDHQALPFEKLVEELQPRRDLSCTPLFQVMFVLQNTPSAALALQGLTLCPLDVVSHTSKFDLTLSMLDTKRGLTGRLEYSTDLFDATTMARMLRHFHTLLEGIAANHERRLSDLPLLTAAERQQLLVTWNNTKRDFPQATCIHHIFETQVEHTPDAIAVMCGASQVSYRTLNQRANQLAYYLQALRVGPEIRVGLCLERSLEMVVGLLAILKAGGVYVPLDPGYPQQRLAYMLEDSQAMVLLTQQRLADRLPRNGAHVVCLDTDCTAFATPRQENPHSDVMGENLAYIIYTSGSTGRPKGVMISHRAIRNHLCWMQADFPLTESDRVVQKAPCSFDASVWELFAPFLAGGTLVMARPGGQQDSTYLIELIAQHHVTVMKLVPSLLQMLLGEPALESCSSLRRVFCGGEPLPPQLPEQFFARLSADFHQHYGPTEAAVVVSCSTCERGSQRCPVPIGRPTANTQIYLLDAHLHPVPIGMPGELHVGGVGLARGYMNRPGLTAEKFIPHPFSNEPGARLYRTGDLARYAPDGNLEFLGRVDHQVKIRGHRIELGEIEMALERHPSIHQAVVVAREDQPGDLRLVAYVVADQEAVPPIGALHRFLKTTLPDSMLPSAYMTLSALPLTPNGKIDRGALPAPGQTRPELETTFVIPRTPTEEVLVGVWGTVLGIEQVGIHDNFFELGGHSLLATQVMSRLRGALQLEVPVRALFDTPTVAGLALHLETIRQTEQHVPAAPIVPRPREGVVPVSVGQEQLWRLDQVLPGTSMFNMPYALCLTGTLNVAALEQSFNELIRRHEALRTAFVTVDGQPAQAIAGSLSLSLTVEDLRVLPADERHIIVQELAIVEAQQPFNLAQSPLVRVRLLQLDEREHVLLLTMHHIISDGWSIGVLTHELAVLYDAFASGNLSPLPVLLVQYADFAYWQRQWRYSAVREAQLSYWKRQLRAPLPVLELPTDRPRTATLSFRTARQLLLLPGVLSEALTSLSRREGCTLFITLLAAFTVLLYSHTRQEDVRVGTLVANRNRQEIEGLIGCFVNTVLLRTHLGGNPTFREVLQRVRETTLTAYAHQDLPFEELVQALEREQNLSRLALCQMMFIFQPAMPQPLKLPTLTLSFLEYDESVGRPNATATTFDIIFMVKERRRGLSVSCIYKTQLFDAATIDRLLEDFQLVLERLVSQPEQALSTFGLRSRDQVPDEVPWHLT